MRLQIYVIDLLAGNREVFIHRVYLLPPVGVTDHLRNYPNLISEYRLVLKK